MKKIIALTFVTVLTAGISSCGKYRKFDNNEVIENTYSGNVAVTSTGADPAGDFTGNGDAGTYSFAWENKNKKCNANFDVTTSGGGTVQMKVYDKKGNVVLDQTLPNNGEDTYSGVSEEGKPGMWKVELILNNFNGDGSYSLSPGS